MGEQTYILVEGEMTFEEVEKFEEVISLMVWEVLVASHMKAWMITKLMDIERKRKRI